MHLANYCVLLQHAETALAESFEVVAEGHERDAGVHSVARTLATACRALADALRPAVERYGPALETDPDRWHPGGVTGTREGEIGLVRDLQDLYVLGSLVEVTWTIVGQAARGVRDRDLLELTDRGRGETAGQLAWLRSQLKVLSPQALITT